VAKRGRKPKNPNLLESVDPKVAREILAVGLAVLAVVAILSEFGAAGKLGATLFSALKSFFGVIAYIFPLWLGYAAVYLFNPNFYRRSRAVFWGTLLFLIFFAGLVGPFGSSGGAIGNFLFVNFSALIGKYATLTLFFAACLVCAIVIFNVSLNDLLGRVRLKPNRYGGFNVREGGISVFKTVRRKIGMDRERPQPAVPVVSAPDGAWQFPTVDLLESSTGKAQPGNIAKNVEILIKTLSDFGVVVSAGNVNIGPTVTQYELKPAEGVKLNTIKARSDDLALALAAHPVRVEAPIPGKSALGVEVPNKVLARVSLKQLLESENFKKRPSGLALPLGMDVAGEVIVADLEKMPHLLVAGATGSGKSVGLNSILLSLLFQNSPRDLRVLLVDPKRVEFTHYNGIPHLLTPVVFDVEKAVNLLRWTISEMDRRFTLFQGVGARDIASYNAKVKQGLPAAGDVTHEKLPYIVTVIDELADLMMQAANEVEVAVVRLAQLARATGIHLVVATQRPSVDVITGLIKANITSRVAFAVASQVDSRTIIDQAGAEKLLGNGDMLFLGGEFSKPKRIQGAFVSEKDIRSVTDFLKRGGAALYNDSITDYREVPGIKGRGARAGGGLEGSDPMLDEAKQLVVESGTASATFLQRRLKIGYARAARLLDLLEEEGIVGPGRGAKPRDILMDSYDLRGTEDRHFPPGQR